VALRGLPIGSTLVLINGRRLESTSGSQALAGSFFDLNNIPLAAVERIEVVPVGSSAVYGGDALAGIVNIVLRKDFQGFEVSEQYGQAIGQNRQQANLALGRKGDGFSLSAIGFYSMQAELAGSSRAITRSDNHVPQGGPDLRLPFANPANIFSVNGANLPGLNYPQASVPPGSSGVGLTPASFASTAGVLDKASLIDPYFSLSPEYDRYGGSIYGTARLTPSIEVYTEVLTSHTIQSFNENPSIFSGIVPATNPFNPFGESVRIDYNFAKGLPPTVADDSSTFFRSLVGARGSLAERWAWDLAGWVSSDRDAQTGRNGVNRALANASLAATNPSEVLNVFQDGPGGSPALLASLAPENYSHYEAKLGAANGFVRGPIASLPGGPLEVLLGGEYVHDRANSTRFTGTNFLDGAREDRSIFGEVRLPLWQRLTVTSAARFDDYSDFGSRWTPQVAAIFRPSEPLSLSASYADSFKPPSLYSTYTPQLTLPGLAVDPKRGNEVSLVPTTTGGNPNLQAETGSSHALDFAYRDLEVRGLEASVTWWFLTLRNGIAVPNVPTILANEEEFPGFVVRAPPTPADIAAGRPGKIVSIKDLYFNFGSQSLAGFDYLLRGKVRTDFGEFEPSIVATQTYRYRGEDVPGGKNVDRVSRADSFGYAPRWKGTVALEWREGPVKAGVDGRYVSSYLDYNSLTRHLGNFWYLDANLRLSVKELLGRYSSTVSSLDIVLGGTNLLNQQPVFSNFNGGYPGYDPAQYDIVGRLLYAQVRVRL